MTTTTLPAVPPEIYQAARAVLTRGASARLYLRPDGSLSEDFCQHSPGQSGHYSAAEMLAEWVDELATHRTEEAPPEAWREHLQARGWTKGKTYVGKGIVPSAAAGGLAKGWVEGTPNETDAWLEFFVQPNSTDLVRQIAMESRSTGFTASLWVCGMPCRPWEEGKTADAAFNNLLDKPLQQGNSVSLRQFLGLV